MATTNYSRLFSGIFFCLLLLPQIGFAQEATLAERLGYPADARLLIIHADDLAVTHSENEASFYAIERGVVNSASVMAPCPWLREVAYYARANPDHDFGMHLTLTNEWKYLSWGPVAGKTAVPSLVDSAGYLYPDCGSVAANATLADIETELRAQIELAIELGIQPTHLDSHMGCLFYGGPEIFEIYVRLGREYGIPALVSADALAQLPATYRDRLQPEDIIVDRILTIEPDRFIANEMDAYYAETLRDLPAGVSVLLIHCAYDDRESQGMGVDHPLWGSNWRQQDFDFFTSDRCRAILEAEGIQLVTWREVGALLGG
jgi:chitin disaccharide deacetylase